MLQSLISYLFTPRREAGASASKRLFTSPSPIEFFDGIVLALYAAVLSWDIVHHLPWVDEAQAWLIARDDPMRDMLLRRLHYEGAPPLWHLILKAAVCLHLPYAGLNWLAGAFALTGIVVLIRFSPFPRIIRWLLPFTFFLQYQYAVIARPYVLAPLLLFTLSIVFSLPKPRPLLFALVAGLLANINAHTGILSCVFALIYLYDLYRRPGPASPSLKRKTILGAGLFAALCTMSVVIAFPAPDAMVVPYATGRVKPSNPILRRVIPPEKMPPSAPPLDPSLLEVTRLRLAPGSPLAAPPTGLQRLRNKFRSVRHYSEGVAVFPIAESNLLGVLFLALFVLWLWSRGNLLTLLPWLITIPISAIIWIYDHHSGIFAIALMAAAWISLNNPRKPDPSKTISAALAAVTLLVLVLQIGWTIHQVRMETNHPYDAGKQTEAFLAANEAGKRVAAFGFESVSMQPYATRNLFFNQEHTYWVWSNANPIDLRRTEALLQHPDVVVVADRVQKEETLLNQWREEAPVGERINEEMVRFWEENGYHETHRFCGYRYMRAGLNSTYCELILEPGSLHREAQHSSSSQQDNTSSAEQLSSFGSS